MQTYTVRSKEGIMLMRLVGEPADAIVRELDGHWRTYNDTVCYELEVDSVWEREMRGGAMKLFLWAGTVLIKD